MFLEGNIAEGDEGIVNVTWVNENLDTILAQASANGFVASVKPIPPPKVTATQKKAKEAEEAIQKLKDARASLIAQGVDVSNIAAFEGLDDEEVDETVTGVTTPA